MNLTLRKVIIFSVLSVVLGVSLVYGLSFWLKQEKPASGPLGATPTLIAARLLVFAYSDKGFVQASVTVTGTESPNPPMRNATSANTTAVNGTTTTDLQNPLELVISPGVYSIVGTYGSAPAQNATADLTEIGAWASVVLNFGSSQPPPLGHIVVTAWYWGQNSGSYVPATVTLSGPENIQGTISASDYNLTVFTVKPGTFSVSGTYESAPPQSATVNVTAGEFTGMLLDFSPYPPA